MDVSLVPGSQVCARLKDGWTMLVGYPLEPGDYAVIMAPPGWKNDPARNVNKGQKSAEQTKLIRKFASRAEIRAA